jgi:PAS domain S-box-containing protein
MHNKLAAKVLLRILDAHSWTQGDLSAKTSIARSMISEHISGQRAIRDEHLANYLPAFDRRERQMLTAAWLRDRLTPESISDVLDITSNRLREEVTTWSPGLTLEQERYLAWWKDALARDPEIAQIFRGITLKAGYPNPYDQLTIAVVVTDAAGLTTYANPAFIKMCGYPLEKLRGRKPGHLLQGPKTEKAVVAELRAAIADRRFLEVPSLTNYHADGLIYRVHIKLHPIFDPFSTLIQFRAIEEKLD